MEIRELRIGNIIRSKRSGLFPDNPNPTAWEISEADMAIMIECGIGDYVPVELSAEWLERFGFKRGYGAFNHIWHNNSVITLDDIGGCWTADVNNNPIKGEVKFVHQLQNLYYALCGVELVLGSPPGRI